SVGQVHRAVKEVESSVSDRVSTEVKRRLEHEPTRSEKPDAPERLIAEFGGSVCMIQGTYGFGKTREGKFRMLREASSRVLEGMDVDEDKVPLMLTGDGPLFRVEFTGTGFVVGEGLVMTNRHIAQPWWRNDAAQPLIQDGFEPRLIALRAYFPGREKAIVFNRKKTVHSKEADLAVLFFDTFAGQPRALKLGADNRLIPGRRVLLFGYPSGLDALLARSHEDFADQFANEANSDPVKVLDALARENLVRPLPTQGHIGDVLGDKVLFDAPTAVGGSGGPLVDLEGHVVAVNYGILKAFRGANFGVPVHYARKLLERARSTH
ncbi:MAG: serine protease, partial [Planctomycetota bacterium]|nr:serine protease [Planctomycetota bacterium]